jgi:nicotinamidase-related amidase
MSRRRSDSRDENMPHPTKMSPADTALLVIDVQEKLLPLIPEADSLIRNIAFLIDAARVLAIPVLATEQYPKGLGPTVPALKNRLADIRDKTAFSSCAAPQIMDRLHQDARVKVVLAGIETHVCVLQTALDLLADRVGVYVAADAVSSRYRVDHEYALRRMEQAGAVLVTAETAVFEWTGGSNTPQFKDISKLVQERMKQVTTNPLEKSRKG